METSTSTSICRALGCVALLASTLLAACGGATGPAGDSASATQAAQALATSANAAREEELATIQGRRRYPRRPPPTQAAWPAFYPSTGAESLAAWGLAPRSTPLLPALPDPRPSVDAATGATQLSFVTDPRTTVFGTGHVPTEVARIADENTTRLPGTRFGHAYAKVSPWNADNSLALVFVTGPAQATRAVLLDGKTFAYKSIVRGVFAGGRWSKVDPATFFEIGAGGTPRLEATNVYTNLRRTVKDFSGDGYVEQARTSLFGGEGNQSQVDRIWVLQLRHETRGWELVIWDAVTDRIRGRIGLPTQANIGGVVDDWAVSPKGNYIKTYSSADWTSGNGEAIPSGHNIWSLDGRYLRNVPGTPAGHLDLCLDAAGQEVVAFVDSKYVPNDKTGQTWRIDGSAGNATVDQFIDGTMGWNFHISCQSTDRPDIMVVSSFPATTPQSYDSFPMWNHIFAVRLDGSKKIAVIANAHHDVSAAGDNLYNRMSFAVANRDFSAVWFTAAWDRASGPVYSYVARPQFP